MDGFDKTIFAFLFSFYYFFVIDRVDGLVVQFIVVVVLLPEF
jgi:hypothetical protein